MSFELEKLYADLVTEDGTVGIVYAASLSLGRFAYRYAGAELFRPDGSRETLRATGPRASVALRSEGDACDIRFDSRAGPVDLRYRNALSAWGPAGPPAARGLDWRVEIPRGEARLLWPGPVPEELEGTGYVDRVRLTRPVWPRDLARLDWGRVHAGRTTLVFTRVTSAAGQVWQHAARWRDGDAPKVTRELRIQESRPDPDDPAGAAGPGSLCVRVGSGPDGIEVRLDRGRRIHHGVVVEAAPGIRWWDRTIVRALAGRLLDDRRAAGATTDAGDSGWAVYETVTRRARQLRP